MKELIQQIINIPDANDDFIFGTINYAKKDPSHISSLKAFMSGKENLTSSDIVAFIISQPDFHSYSATTKQVNGELLRNQELLSAAAPFRIFFVLIITCLLEKLLFLLGLALQKVHLFWWL